MRTGPTHAILAAGDRLASNNKRLRMKTVKNFNGRDILEQTEMALQVAKAESLELVKRTIDCVASIFYNVADFNELGPGASRSNSGSLFIPKRVRQTMSASGKD